MTRNHSASSRGLQQFLGRKLRYEPKNQFEENYAHYPTETVEKIRNQVSLSALRGADHPHGLAEGRPQVARSWSARATPTSSRRRCAAPTRSMPGSATREPVQPDRGQNDINEDRAAGSAGLDMDSDLRERLRHCEPEQRGDLRGRSRAACPASSSTSTRASAFRPTRSYLNSTMDTLRTLAENTDGRAIVNRNDIAAGMKQITRDSSALLPDRLQLGAGAHRRKVPRDQGEGEAARRCRFARGAATGRSTARKCARDRASRRLGDAEAGGSGDLQRRGPARRARASCASWVGMSRGENGKTARDVRLGTAAEVAWRSACAKSRRACR